MLCYVVMENEEKIARLYTIDVIAQVGRTTARIRHT